MTVLMVAVSEALRNFFKDESAVGVLLIIATILAMLLSNSPLTYAYQNFLDIPVVVSIHEFTIAKPLLLWVNDGLMAIFFFMVGMEIKREVLEGSLNHISKIVVPVFAAVGGMIVPALVYIAFNWDDPVGMQGWAIPMATDIAFALGVLSLLGRRVPAELKIFLLALAIIDDLGAIIVIAVFLFICDVGFDGLDEIIKKKQGYNVLCFGKDKKTKEEQKPTYDMVEPDDLVSYGLIPELVGRLPIIASLQEITEEDMVRILTEPKNSLVKQYKKLLLQKEKIR